MTQNTVVTDPAPRGMRLGGPALTGSAFAESNPAGGFTASETGGGFTDPGTGGAFAEPETGGGFAEPGTGGGFAEPETGGGEPRWLSGPEMAAWLNLTQLLMLLPSALDRQLRDDAGIPHAYYQILATLSAAPGRSMRMTDLARMVGTTTSRLSHAVASLEQRGWVCRQACAFDKRGQIASLTEQGTSVLESAAPGHVAEVRRLIFDHLTATEVDQLRAITGKILPAATA